MTQTAPALVAVNGVGIDTAATPLVAVGQAPRRLKSEAAFAHMCGVAPIPASSGKVVRYRLNRRGNRYANRALHVVAAERMSRDERTRSYVAGRTAEGKSKREATRRLKHYIARELYDVLVSAIVPSAPFSLLDRHRSFVCNRKLELLQCVPLSGRRKNMTESNHFSIIDTDIHERADTKDLLPHLDPKFRHYIEQAGWVPDRALPFAQLTVGGLDRADAKTPDGRPGGSDLGMMQQQLLDEYNHEYGILTGWLNAGGLHHGWSEFKTALMSAYNDWQIENWLDKEDRLMGSININPYDPQGAVREIERLASHPKMVQVMIYIGPTESAFGEPQYHPIYEAAERHNLVVSIHHSENSPTALGFHRYFIEWHTAVPQVFMSEAISLIFNGVFDKYPDLKVILVEGGFSYVPHLMWRADQQYRELYAEVPWVKRLPSDIIRAQMRFSTQPIEEFTTKQFDQIVDQMGSDELICFSTDYPHWDFDSPLEALPAGLSDDLKRKILSENARKIYQRLPAPTVATR